MGLTEDGYEKDIQRIIVKVIIDTEGSYPSNFRNVYPSILNELEETCGIPVQNSRYIIRYALAAVIRNNFWQFSVDRAARLTEIVLGMLDYDSTPLRGFLSQLHLLASVNFNYTSLLMSVKDEFRLRHRS